MMDIIDSLVPNELKILQAELNLKVEEFLRFKKKELEIKQVESQLSEEFLKIKKNDLEIKEEEAKFKLKTTEKNKSFFIILLIVLIIIYCLAFLAIGACVLNFFSKDGESTIDWIHLIFGSLMNIAITVTIMFFCNLLKKVIFPSDEE